MGKIVFFILLFIHVVSVNLNGQIQKNSLLKGTVTDQKGSVVSGATILVKDVSSGKTDESSTDNTGQFQIPVAGGTYLVAANKMGFCPQHRSPFELGQNESVTVNVSLFTCTIKSVVEIGDSKEPSSMQDHYDIPYKQDSVAISNDDIFKEVQIQYGEKISSKGRTVYGPVRLADKSTMPVRLTYNKIQVYASSFEWVSNGLFVATGKVVFENGVDRLEFSRLVFLLHAGTYDLLCTGTEPTVALKDNFGLSEVLKFRADRNGSAIYENNNRY